jgi:hypothetical protein
VTLVIAALLALAAPSPQPVVERVTRGAVTAELSYTVRDDAVRDLRLRILRRGRLAGEVRPRPLGFGGRVAGPLVVRDLDGDREPEVVLDLYSGGAHCCTSSLFFRYVRTRGTYAKATRSWGNQGYRLVDYDRDGQPELSSRDDRFAAAFTAYAASASPIQVWHYDRGRLRIVTRRFLPRIAHDAVQLWREYARIRRSDFPEVRGFLAAWLADQALLGREEEGWRVLEAAERRGELGRGATMDGYPAGRRYLAALRSFLRRTGYLRG